MIAALDAADLLIIAAIMLLIGFLMTVRYTFAQLANVLDVAIGPYHPFAGVADAITKYIVGGLNAGINDLGVVVHDMWLGFVESINAMLDGLESLGKDAVDAFKYLVAHTIGNQIHAVTDSIVTTIKNVKGDISDLSKYAHTQVTRLDGKIDGAITGLKRTLEGEIASTYKTVQGDIHSAINALKGTVEGDIRSAVATAESIASSALTAVANAENAAIGALGQAEDLTARELHDFIKSVPLTDLEALLTAVPILAAVVDVALSESGLNGHECRTKVKGVCGTDPTGWFRMLEGLLVVGAGLSLHEIFKVAQDTAQEAMPIVKRLVA